MKVVKRGFDKTVKKLFPGQTFSKEEKSRMEKVFYTAVYASWAPLRQEVLDMQVAERLKMTESVEDELLEFFKEG